MYKLKSRGTAKATVKKITEEKTYTIRDVSKETTNNVYQFLEKIIVKLQIYALWKYLSQTKAKTNKQKPNFLPGDSL